VTSLVREHQSFGDAAGQTVRQLISASSVA
jgi:hypothetical protein